MATRGIIRIRDDHKKTVVKIYNHWDSYLTGLGRHIANYEGEEHNGLDFVAHLSKFSERMHFEQVGNQDELYDENWDIEFKYVIDRHDIWVYERKEFIKPLSQIFFGTFEDFENFVEAAEQKKKGK